MGRVRVMDGPLVVASPAARSAAVQPHAIRSRSTFLPNGSGGRVAFCRRSDNDSSGRRTAEHFQAVADAASQ